MNAHATASAVDGGSAGYWRDLAVAFGTGALRHAGPTCPTPQDRAARTRDCLACLALSEPGHPALPFGAGRVDAA